MQQAKEGNECKTLRLIYKFTQQRQLNLSKQFCHEVATVVVGGGDSTPGNT